MCVVDVDVDVDVGVNVNVVTKAEATSTNEAMKETVNITLHALDTTHTQTTHLLLEVVTLLLAGGGISFGISTLADLHAVVGLVPLTKWGGIDLDNGVLDQCLGADQLVVGGVVDDVNNAHLLGAGWHDTRARKNSGHARREGTSGAGRAGRAGRAKRAERERERERE
jgi:hypothetical protein